MILLLKITTKRFNNFFQKSVFNKFPNFLLVFDLIIMKSKKNVEKKYS